MSRTHYEVLGVKPGCSAEEIRSAYRKLVLRFHPDRSTEPRAADIFIAITESYEVLNDRDKRREYDRLLAVEKMRPVKPQPTVQTANPRPAPTKPAAPRTQVKTTPRSATLTVELTKLSVLFSRGQYGEAEKLAKRVRQAYPTQPLPYAVLADIARSRGDMKEAAKLYAYAVQMDPSNEHYRLRYEELIRTEQVQRTTKKDLDVHSIEVTAPLLGLAVVLLACVYVAISTEMPMQTRIAIFGSWTMGLVVMSFFCGVVAGASLRVGKHLDRFQASVTNTLGRISPTIALATVAIVNFWAAAAIYLAMGSIQRGFNYSTSRLVASVAGVTLLLAASASVAHLSPGPVALWGGNLAYVGALCGWMVADSLARS